MNIQVSRFILLTLFLSCISIFSYAELSPSQIPLSLTGNITLPLECVPVIGSARKLCTIITESSYGPYDDVVFYRIEENGQTILLSKQSGEVSTFAGFGFSTGGKYMWVGNAEEGHPFFTFYMTKDFLERGSDAASIETLSDYYFEHFERFTDSGTVIYSLADDFNHDDKSSDEFILVKDPATGNNKYMKRFYLEKIEYTQFSQ